ncbi:MAG: methyltransferase type 11 [Ruminococcus sp.]|nr:methyltransferase type 11 [Ruminococcus sp.]
MSNPWEEISLDDYEKHMSLESVGQLQMMNLIMKQQLEDYPVNTAMIFGIAGGNGLEHVRRDKYVKVYGVDINADYLCKTQKRYPNLSGVLECVNVDLVSEYFKLPQAQLVIANLLIEYIGYAAFQKAVLQVKPRYVSCTIQINTGTDDWVSDSPYLHAFDRLDEIHHQMEKTKLEQAMQKIGYQTISQMTHNMPNGKALLRLDFEIV